VPTIADLLAEWDARGALEQVEDLEQGVSAPLDEETRRVIAKGEAMRHRGNATLARQLAERPDATEQERERLLWYADHYDQEADRLDQTT
jgi:hypothetical protein